MTSSSIDSTCQPGTLDPELEALRLRFQGTDLIAAADLHAAERELRCAVRDAKIAIALAVVSVTFGAVASVAAARRR